MKRLATVRRRAIPWITLILTLICVCLLVAMNLGISPMSDRDPKVTEAAISAFMERHQSRMERLDKLRSEEVRISGMEEKLERLAEQMEELRRRVEGGGK